MRFCTNLYNNIIRTLVCLAFIISGTTILAQNKTEYFRYIDSANVYVHTNPDLALKFLDSIPTPPSRSIDGELARYYLLKGMLYHKSGEQAQLFNSFIQAVKYGEMEKNYDVAGQASLDLFSNAYALKKDSSAFKFLDQARKYYTLANNENGLIEVEQMPAYMAFQDHRYEESNRLLLANLDRYENVEDDAYYHMFALFMLTSNYIHLGDTVNSEKYFQSFKSLQNNPTIAPYNYKSYEVDLNICNSHLALENKNFNSALAYLAEASGAKAYMEHVSIKEYYTIYSDTYEHIGNIEMANIYRDSLRAYEKLLLEDNISASFEIHENLLKTEEELKIEEAKKQRNLLFALSMVAVLIVLIVIFSLTYARLLNKLKGLFSKLNKTSYLNRNQERLSAKVQGLEDLIKDYKKQMKKISLTNDVEKQRNMIRELYSELNLKSSTLLSNEKHLEIVNDSNAEFFINLREQSPQLTELETLVCYYLFLDFKNKEIAVFLNRSVRAIESIRYRLVKKLELEKNGESLVDFLHKAVNS